MGLLLLDLLLAGGGVAVVRWAWPHPRRFVPLTVATLAATAFTVLRNQYNLEDSEFLLLLAASCALAGAVTAGVAPAVRQAWRTASIHGAFAAFLVPLLYGGYLAVALTICWVTACDRS
jgi:hypothetical protein